MTETYAHLSNNAVYSATIVFTLALLRAHRGVGGVAPARSRTGRGSSRGHWCPPCRRRASVAGSASGARRPCGRRAPPENDEDDLERATGTAGSASR